MSLLTKISGLKSKYKTTSGKIRGLTAQLEGPQGLFAQRSEAITKADTYQKSEEYTTAKTTFETALEAFETTQQEFSELAQTFQADYGGYNRAVRMSDQPLTPEAINKIATGYESQLRQDFMDSEHYNIYNITSAFIKSDGREWTKKLIYYNNPGSWDEFLEAEQFFKETYQDPVSKMNTDLSTMEPYITEDGSLATTYSAYETAEKAYQPMFDTLKSYRDVVTGEGGLDSQIEGVQSQLQQYGLDEGEIQQLLSQAQYMYGMSTEQRKRGTRGSVRRRSALTSRSGYA